MVELAGRLGPPVACLAVCVRRSWGRAGGGDISGCLLGEEDDGSDLAKEIASLNAVLEGAPTPTAWNIVSIEQGETLRVF